MQNLFIRVDISNKTLAFCVQTGLKRVGDVEISDNIVVGGMSFIEHVSFDAFNELTRLIQFVELHKKLFSVETNRVGDNTGYQGRRIGNTARSMA